MSGWRGQLDSRRFVVFRSELSSTLLADLLREAAARDTKTDPDLDLDLILNTESAVFPHAWPAP
ncbi:MAG: hypothetical protein FJ194_10745 [Gammaproteobacteria bacterium]|nr:hypothetical protein [Gammaproteobacteria bacterium]